jgi:hypothetical protein
MKKPMLIAPVMTAREMMDGPDLDRLLASGSWAIATLPKKPSPHVIAQRDYIRRQLAAGYRKFHCLLPDTVFNELRLRLRAGETFAELVERLLSIPDNDPNHISDKQK